jgi:hypothetical protein
MIFSRRTGRARLDVALVLLGLLVVSGCAHRLRGPNHGGDAPPWIAPGSAAPPPKLELRHRVVLIGDAGYYLEDDPTLAALGRWTRDAERSSVVFLGDNIYNEGMTDEDRARGEKILGHQLAASEARKFVIPGNHDWGFFSKKYNAKSIRNQQLFVDGWPDGQADFLPKDGCMGPEARVLSTNGENGASGPSVVLIALDPTPWIHPRLRASCSRVETPEAHLAALESLLVLHRDDFVIVASHYPMKTGGPHGGLSYGFAADLVVTPLGWMMGGLGNTDEAGYADWIEATQAVLRRHPPAIYAAGHDHNLQLLDADGVAGIYVVSGAGAVERVSTVTHLPETRFAHAVPGFIAADFGTSGGKPVVVLRVVESMGDAKPGAGGEPTPDVPAFELTLPLD